MKDETFVKDDFTYAVKGGQATLNSYKGREARLTIPETLGGYAITSIGKSAFYFCRLTKVTIPHSVTSIGSGAFFGCDNLIKITIPNSVVTIGNSAFHFCHNLTEVTIPNSVTTIGKSAFESCHSLTVLTIPKSVKNIGTAFNACIRLSAITVDNENAHYSSDDNGVLFNKNKTKLMKYPELHKQGNSYTIPDSVTSIEEWAFADCSEFSGFCDFSNFPELEDCSGLTEIVIPNSVTNIGYEAFYGCSDLRELTIPDSVTRIGKSAFDSGIIIRGTKNSFAHRYAIKNKLKFKEVI